MDKNKQSKNDYRKQRNLCVSLIHRKTQEYFSSFLNYFGKQSNRSFQARFLIEIELD